MNNKLGIIFRQLREMKNLSLSQTCQGICSKSQLSRFEKGENDIGATKLFALLSALNVTPEEFIYQLRDFDLSDFERLFSSVGSLEEERQLSKIEQLRQNERQQSGVLHQLNAFAIQSILALHEQAPKLTDKEITQISDYLFSILEWSRYEIYIFQATSWQLAYPLCLEFADELMKRTEFYRKVPLNRALVANCMKNLAFVALKNHDLTHAEKFRQQFLELLGKNDWSRLIAPTLLQVEILKAQDQNGQADTLYQQLISAYSLLGRNPKNLTNLQNEKP